MTEEQRKQLEEEMKRLREQGGTSQFEISGMLKTLDILYPSQTDDYSDKVKEVIDNSKKKQ